MENFGRSMLLFWISYILVTCVGIGHTIFNIYVRHMSPMDRSGMGKDMNARNLGTRSITLFYSPCSASFI